MNYKRVKIKIYDMTCPNCKLKIENALNKLKGIIKVKVNYKQALAEIIFDESIINYDQIKQEIISTGYNLDKIDNKESFKKILILIIIITIFLLLKYNNMFNILNTAPTIDSNMEYSLLFLIGLLTSFHCIAMCGGINISQSLSAVGKTNSCIKPNIYYNIGRVISYTIIGGIIGSIGYIFNFNLQIRSLIIIFASIFMLIMGLNILNIFPILKYISPKIPKKLNNFIYSIKRKSNSSFYIGLLNGFMPCGPLQAMQLYALSTKSFVSGAIAMFVFSIGTVPLMFILGTLSSKLNKKFTSKMINISAFLVIILGLNMLINGLSLSGISLNNITNTSDNGTKAKIIDNYQVITVNLDYGTYPDIVVKKDLPVKFIIIATKETLNGCNNNLVISHFNINTNLKEGENVIEFTPTDLGTFNYSCWMGMINGTITVK